MATEINDIVKEGRSPDRPGAGPPSAGSVSAGARDARGLGRIGFVSGKSARQLASFFAGTSSRVRSETRKGGTSLASFFQRVETGVGFVFPAAAAGRWLRPARGRLDPRRRPSGRRNFSLM